MISEYAVLSCIPDLGLKQSITRIEFVSKEERSKLSEFFFADARTHVVEGVTDDIGEQTWTVSRIRAILPDVLADFLDRFSKRWHFHQAREDGINIKFKLQVVLEKEDTSHNSYCDSLVYLVPYFENTEQQALYLLKYT